jgi:hypothetical protein
MVTRWVPMWETWELMIQQISKGTEGCEWQLWPLAAAVLKGVNPGWRVVSRGPPRRCWERPQKTQTEQSQQLEIAITHCNNMVFRCFQHLPPLQRCYTSCTSYASVVKCSIFVPCSSQRRSKPWPVSWLIRVVQVRCSRNGWWTNDDSEEIQ